MTIDGNGPKVVDLPKKEDDQISGEIERMRRIYDQMAPGLDVIAKHRFRSYEAHVKAGFNPAQALELCWR